MINNNPTSMLKGMVPHVEHSPKDFNTRFSAYLFALHYKTNNNAPPVGLNLSVIDFVARKKLRNKGVQKESMADL